MIRRYGDNCGRPIAALRCLDKNIIDLELNFTKKLSERWGPPQLTCQLYKIIIQLAHFQEHMPCPVHISRYKGRREARGFSKFIGKSILNLLIQGGG